MLIVCAERQLVLECNERENYVEPVQILPGHEDL